MNPLCIIWVIWYILVAFVKLFIPRSLRYKRIQDEVAVVTGAGSGIGQLMAIELAKEGCHVICWDVNSQGNEDTVSQIRQLPNGKAHSFVVDVGQRESVYAAAGKIPAVTDGKDVTILINNAGVVFGKHLLEIPDDKIDQMLNINCLGHFWTTKSFLPGMMKCEKGHIVTISSMMGLWCPLEKMTAYASSKFGAFGFDQALNSELKITDKDFIKTTIVTPGHINTGMFHGASFRYGLEADYVAREIIASLKAEDETRVIPSFGYLVYLIYAVLPRTASFELTKGMKLNTVFQNLEVREPLTTPEGKKND
ncbi:unnamed protein product [Cyprideis torosa]|uniref:Short-chain dehydrogenase/reductase 3 n=1 Tax=Cyprideis torosa TaxID=163714 RepID=A0A7R8WED2_9CRUS|nr:unnamed protein product [Cyprideis torosa]CAG0894224.1 unnamed protein product [Cyprideis torosa]